MRNKRVAQQLDGAKLDRSRFDGADAARGAMAALLTAPGPKPVLTDEQHTAAVRMFCGVPEPETGGVCELCGKLCEPGHHRVCASSFERATHHHATVRAVCAHINECAAAYAHAEDDVRAAGELAARADVRLSDGTYVEVKTVDTRQSHRGKLFADTAETLAAKVSHKYGSIKCSHLIITHCGSLSRASAKTVAQLQRLHDDSWPLLEAPPSLLAQLGAAAAKAEWASYSAWHERLHTRDTAGALLDAMTQRVTHTHENGSTGTEQSPRDAGETRDRSVGRMRRVGAAGKASWGSAAPAEGATRERGMAAKEYARKKGGVGAVWRTGADQEWRR